MTSIYTTVLSSNIYLHAEFTNYLSIHITSRPVNVSMQNREISSLLFISFTSLFLFVSFVSFLNYMSFWCHVEV